MAKADRLSDDECSELSVATQEWIRHNIWVAKTERRCLKRGDVKGAAKAAAGYKRYEGFDFLPRGVNV